MCKRNGRAVKIALLAIFLFLIVWFSIPFTALRVRDSVVMVHIESYGFPAGLASGVIVDDGIILTARHVVKDADKIWITLDDGTQLVSTEFYEAEDTDLGLIIFDANDAPPEARLSFFEPFIGQTYGLFNSFFKGFVGAKDRLVYYFGSKRMIQLDLAGNPGDSGCPVFNRFGRIAGIVVGGRPDGITFIVPAKTCRLFLNVYYADRAMRKGQ